MSDGLGEHGNVEAHDAPADRDDMASPEASGDIGHLDSPAGVEPHPLNLTTRERLRAYLELSRISNLPTVWSNVLTGGCLGAMAVVIAALEAGVQFVAPPTPATTVSLLSGLIPLAIGVSLLYIGGMALNDVADYRHDLATRSTRPIASGRIPRGSAIRFVLLCFIAGGALVILPTGLAPSTIALLAFLLIAIVSYDLLNKRFPIAVLLMGLCRGLVYALGASIVWTDWASKTHIPLTTRSFLIVGTPAIAITLYTLGITVIARRETQSTVGPRRWIAIVMPVLVALAAGYLAIENQSMALQAWTSLWPWIGVMLACGAWLWWAAQPIRHVFAKPPRTVPAILCFLSGMCLVDMLLLAALGRPYLALFAVGCFLLTAWGHRRIAGT